LLWLLARIGLGVLFVYMGFKKAVDPIDFLKLIRQYNLFDSPMLLNSVAALLPWFEVFCGLLLLVGVAVRGTALVLITMLVPFTIVVVRRGLEIASAQALAFCAVKFDCGCGAGEILICHKLVENTVVTLLCLGLMAGKGRLLALWYPQRPRPDLPDPSDPRIDPRDDGHPAAG
jgi:uncharacterized membrane protein YphA (DoxX/SURF4 family)